MSDPPLHGRAAAASPSGRTTPRSRKSNGCSTASAPKRAGWTCWSTTSGAVTPGFLRSEHVLDHFGVTEANWRDAIEKDPYFVESETPCYVGRAVAALAADPDVAQKSGRLFSSWGLAKEYGFTDIDGRRPDWGSFFLRNVREILERETPPDEMDLFVIRSRLYQAELDPSAAGEAARLRAWLTRHE